MTRVRELLARTRLRRRPAPPAKGHRRGMRHIAALMAFAIIVPLGVLGIQKAQAAATSFATACASNPSVYVSSGTTTLYAAAQSTTGLKFTGVGSASTWKHNALAMNPTDMYMYAVSQPPNTNPNYLLRIASDGSVTSLGAITGFTSGDISAGVDAGTFDNAGTYWTAGFPATGTGDGNLYSVDISTRKATKKTNNMTIKGHDLAYAYGYLWSMEEGNNIIQRIDPATGTVTELALPSSWFAWPYGATDRYGTMWTYGNGNIGMGGNANGYAYQFSVTNPGSASPTFKLVSMPSIPTSSNNDGTACVSTQPVDLSIVKTVNTAVPAAGANVTYTLTVKNNSTTGSSGFNIDDRLPAGFTFVTSGSSASCTDKAGTGDVSCIGGALAAGATTSFTVVAKVPTPFTATATNTATVTGNEWEADTTNATSSVNVSPAKSELTITKTATPTTVTNAGDHVSYTITARNTGNQNLTAVSVTDAMTSPAGPNPTLACTPSIPVATLTPNSPITCTATYTATQADVNSGTIINTATATGKDPSSKTITATDTATVTAPAAASVSLVKRVSQSVVNNAGTSVTYYFDVTNTGNVDLTNVGVTEGAFTGHNPISAVTCAAGTLSPGATRTCTATYTVHQSDIDAGGVQNTATATGTPPTGTAVTSAPASASITSTPAPALILVKSASPTSVAAAGATVTYNFRVTNTGNVSMSNLAINETSFTGTGTAPVVTCPSVTLAPATYADCTATYTVTQADVNSGAVVNHATATGKTPGGAAVTSPEAQATVTIPKTASVTLTKTANPTTVTAAGQKVNYTFRVTNGGNVTLSSVNIEETAFSGTGTAPVANCPTTTLQPAEFTDCTATYTITQADVNAGTVTNTAVAHGTPPNSGTAINSAPSTAVVTIPVVKAIALTKTADPVVVTKAGTRVTYTYRVTNNSTITVSGASIEETAFSGSGTTPAPSCPKTTLNPTEYTDCTATYTITQADINAGTVTNTAVAHATPAGDTSAIDSPVAGATVTADSAAAISVTKSVNPTSVTAAGKKVDYTFRVKNEGNVTLSSVGVTETAFSGSGTAPVPRCPKATLEPDEYTDCTATYTVTQADVDAGKVTNSATASGTPPTGGPVTSPESTADVTIPAVKEVSLTKTANPTTATTVGATVAYTFHVKNEGNVTLTGVVVTETAFSGSGTTPVPNCPKTTLEPAEYTDCTAKYTITQADVNAGKVTNTAVAHGTAPGDKDGDEDQTAVDSPPASATVTIPAVKAITLAKSASPTVIDKAGDTVTYTFRVKNEGNVTLTGVVVSETEFSGSGTTPVPNCPKTTLEPAEYTDCTATYTITQADVNAGTIGNTATATGTPPSGSPVTSGPSTATVTAPHTASITVVKSVDKTLVSTPGTEVAYTFTVTNTGNVSLTSVNVTEEAFSGHGTLSALSCPATTLAPGGKTVCTATYTVTQADVDTGTVTNTAVAHGTPPGATPVDSLQSSATITLPAAPRLVLTKTADPATVAKAGAVISYTFQAQNAGNVTLTGIGIEETRFTGTGTLSAITCPAGSLAPQASKTCTATYTATQADVNSGTISNTAVAHATAGTDTTVDSDPSTATVTTPASLPPAPALSIVKRAYFPTDTEHTFPIPAGTVLDPGTEIVWVYTVTDTGTTVIGDVHVGDLAHRTGDDSPHQVPVTCPVTELGIGQSVDCTGTGRV